MQSNISSIISALKIIKKENPDSDAIGLLEDALKKSMKFYNIGHGFNGVSNRHG